MALKALELLRKMDALLRLEDNHGAAIRRLDTAIASLTERVARLEAREELMVAKAEGAAGSAAATAVAMSIADLARRIGALDERTRRLSSPGSEPNA